MLKRAVVKHLWVPQAGKIQKICVQRIEFYINKEIVYPTEKNPSLNITVLLCFAKFRDTVIFFFFLLIIVVRIINPREKSL